jgi:hypothetical protein
MRLRNVLRCPSTTAFVLDESSAGNQQPANRSQPHGVTDDQTRGSTGGAFSRKQAEAIRDLEETNKIYANQIQVLALRNEELQEENRRLTGRIEAAAGVSPIRPR